MIFSASGKPPRRILCAFAALFAAMLLLCACGPKGAVMRDGFYSAEALDFDEYGWKEYITIYVADNTIITVDYNAKNASGFMKSWDMEYMRLMNAVDGTYPNKYTREYAEALLIRQNPERVDAISGATHSYHSFQSLVKAAVAQSLSGDKNVAYVDLTGATDQ